MFHFRVGVLAIMFCMTFQENVFAALADTRQYISPTTPDDDQFPDDCGMPVALEDDIDQSDADHAYDMLCHVGSKIEFVPLDGCVDCRSQTLFFSSAATSLYTLKKLHI
jgi:hypothetical protein